MDEPQRLSVELQPGATNELSNGTTATWEVEIETAAGSLIAFTIPAGGAFRINPQEVFRRFTILSGEQPPLGPRLVLKN